MISEKLRQELESSKPNIINGKYQMYSDEYINYFRDKAIKNNYFGYFDEIAEGIYKGKDFGTIEIKMDGGRIFGKTYNAMLSVNKGSALKEKNLDIYAFRWQKTDTYELFGELIDGFENVFKREPTNIELNKTYKSITINQNNLYVKGIHTPNKRKKVKLTGIKRAKGIKYCVVILEERYEFLEEEISQILQAIGGYKNYIIIHITNPNSKAYKYISDMLEEFPKDEYLLKTEGQQFKAEGVEKDYLKIWHYGNWRINPNISKGDIRKITERVWNHNPKKAEITDWGMPGVEDGVIYQYEIPKIIDISSGTLEQKISKIERYSVGIDIGNGNTENASATTMIVMGYDNNGASYALREYRQQNGLNGYKTNIEKANEMLDIIVDMVNEGYGFWQKDNLPIKCEGDFSFIEILQEQARKRELGFLEIKQAKKIRERSRVDIRKYRMNSGKYFVDFKKCPYLLRELEVQEGDETKKDEIGQFKQKDGMNHLTDAEDYAGDEENYEIFEKEEFKLIYGEKRDNE